MLALSEIVWFLHYTKGSVDSPQSTALLSLRLVLGSCLFELADQSIAQQCCSCLLHSGERLRRPNLAGRVLRQLGSPEDEERHSEGGHPHPKEEPDEDMYALLLSSCC